MLIATLTRVARVFLTQPAKTGEKHTKQLKNAQCQLKMQNCPQKFQLFQTVPLQGPPRFTQIGIFCLIIYHLATLTLTGVTWPMGE
jgi:hypothetical protein